MSLRKNLCLVFLCVATAPLCAQVKNADFEEGEIGKPPPGWVVPLPSQAAGYRGAIIEISPVSGKRCAVVEKMPGGGPVKAFGNLMQVFPATSFRGKRWRFRAAIKLESALAGDRAQLWMRVDRAEKRKGFFDNMGDRPITKATWQDYEIVGDVAPDAETINIGLMLLGDGKAMIDNVRFEAAGTMGEGDEPGRPLSGRGLENLTAFARLFGIVRYFHASDESARADWDAFAIDGVRVVESAPDARALAGTLQALFRVVAPSAQVYVTSDGAPLAQTSTPAPVNPSLEVVAWRHFGLGSKDKNSAYWSRRERRSAPEKPDSSSFPDPRTPHTVELGGGTSALVPLAVFADADSTLPKVAADITSPRPAARPEGFRPSGNDRASRLAGVLIAWNVFQHFYPYFEESSVRWSKALEVSLQKAAEDRDESTFLTTLRRLVAQLNDGHGHVHHSSDSDGAVLPIRWDWVDGRLVITSVGSSLKSLNRGDVVLAMDGHSALEAISEAQSLISGATPQWRQWKALEALRLGAEGSRARLSIARDEGKSEDVELERGPASKAPLEPRPSQLSELGPGIVYVNLDTLDDGEFKASLKQLEQARGIVFDLRGYPARLSPSFLGHLTDAPIKSARWNVPVLLRPDQVGAQWKTSDWTLEPQTPRLRAKIAFVTDGRAISYAETCLGIVERYKLGEIVGAPTAGTNGNVNQFRLPGGYSVTWTGMKVLKHDGSRHHGVGIQPTTPVSRTLQGILDGRDELLDRAIKTVNQ